MFLFGCCCTEEKHPDLIEGPLPGFPSKVDVFKEIQEEVTVVSATTKLEPAQPVEESPPHHEVCVRPLVPPYDDDDDEDEEPMELAPPPPHLNSPMAANGVENERRKLYEELPEEAEEQQLQMPQERQSEEKEDARLASETSGEGLNGVSIAASSSFWTSFEHRLDTDAPQESSSRNPVVATAAVRAEAPEAAAVVRGAKGEAEGDGSWSFTVVLECAGKIGLNVRHHGPHALEVLTIKEGLIKDYNQSLLGAGGRAGTEVKIGDVITEVNGSTGTAQMLLKAFADHGKVREGDVSPRLELKFLRGLEPVAESEKKPTRTKRMTPTDFRGS